MRLAEFLLDAVFPPRDTELLVRTASPELVNGILSPVVRGEGAHAVASLFSYTDALAQACILEAKFENHMRAAELLGSALHEFLYESLAERAAFEPAPPILVPLPLSSARLKERGYNQTERVAWHALEKGLRIELDTGLLIRTRSTKPQTSLSGRARRSNVAGAFATVRPCDPYRTYIVFDDVVTTGNTMRAACDALRAGGALRLLPFTLAY